MYMARGHLAQYRPGAYYIQFCAVQRALQEQLNLLDILYIVYCISILHEIHLVN